MSTNDRDPPDGEQPPDSTPPSSRRSEPAVQAFSPLSSRSQNLFPRAGERSRSILPPPPRRTSNNDRDPRDGERSPDSGPPPSNRLDAPSSSRRPASPDSPPSSLSSLSKAILALDKFKAKLEAAERQAAEPIAILGMACRFPGDANTPERFFQLLKEGGCAASAANARRSRADATEHSSVSASDAGQYGAFLGEDVHDFDATFLEVPAWARWLKTRQQRMLFEIAWEALERAGQDPSQLLGSSTGVFIGISTNDGGEVELGVGATGDAGPGAGGTASVPASLSSIFGFRGPSLAIDTAYSSSLVAIHLALQSLRSGESELALVGGVDLSLSRSWIRSPAQIPPPDDASDALDTRADSATCGEGCGLVILKRFSEAQRDRDPILAVIRGSSVYHADGLTEDVMQQERWSRSAMIRAARMRGRVLSENIGYVEISGTEGDRHDEYEALQAVFGRPRDDGSQCFIGTLTSNIGNLGAAAGIAGLIKAVMVLDRELVPRNHRSRLLDPAVLVNETSLVRSTDNEPWKRGDAGRVACVTAVDHSGTNACLVLEEGPRNALEKARPEGSSYILPISARSAESLRALAAAYAQLLAREDGAHLGDLEYSASVRREHHEHRLAVTGRTRAEIGAAFTAFSKGIQTAGVAAGRTPAKGRPKIVFVFSGQGSQWLGMGRQLLVDEPVFREAIETCEDAIQRQSGFSVVEELEVDEARSRLDRVNVVHPVLFAISVGLAALWQSWGVKPDVVIGHGIGEVAAARVAGILGLEDAAKVICRRSQLLGRMSDKGAMALVELALPEARRALIGFEDRLSVASSNGPQSTMIAGDPAALDEVLAALKSRGGFCRRVKVDVAAHSPLMDSLKDDLLAALHNVRPRPALIAMRSTVTGETLSGLDLDASYWAKNLREPVLFCDTMRRLIDEGHSAFVEMSPDPILVSSIKENLGENNQQGLAIASLRRGTADRRAMLDAAGALYSCGYPLRWASLSSRESRCVDLPTYPWHRTRESS